jgi:CRISPR-associated protein Csd2
MSDAIQNRYEFVYLFDVVNGNPNGDPDAGNLPRLDPETSRGLVTDVCLKRKIRNFVQMMKSEQTGYGIYMQERAILNQTHEAAYKAVGLKRSKKFPNGDKAIELVNWLCGHFYDIRTFGAVMSTGDCNCGQIRGPVQLAFARSVEPVVPLEVAITRMAVASEHEAETQDEIRTMGRKHIVPYGLYRAHGFISAKLAERTGFSEDDLILFWDALKAMFEHDHSAARGEMSARRLIGFRHDSALGNAPAHRLFDLVKVQRRNGANGPARSYEDYALALDDGAVPPGVEVLNLL